MVEARGLVKRYGEVVAVAGVSFEVHPGEIFGILGPNGAGKTTTLDLLEGLRRPDAGEALVLGGPMSPSARDLKARIGVQLQATALPAFTTVREALDLFGALFPTRRPTDDLLATFDLDTKADSFCDRLSGGQLQRLSLALALVNDPELVFLDEPTTGLDPAARLSAWEVIEGIRRRGTTVILTTHYMEEAERLCDRVAIMDSGRIVGLDTPARLIARHAPQTRIEFETTSPPGVEALRRLDGVDDVEVDGTVVRLSSRNPERTLAALFDPATRAGILRTTATEGSVATAVALRDLRVRAGTLEDVFLALTGRRLRQG